MYGERGRKRKERGQGSEGVSRVRMEGGGKGREGRRAAGREDGRRREKSLDVDGGKEWRG